jgi:uncharacterized RDD family membrane protein YckC
MLAYGLDVVVRAAVLLAFVLLGNISGAIGFAGLSGFGSGTTLVLVFFLEWGYYVVCELLLDGRSLGKVALRLRVVTDAGRPLGFFQSVIRNLLRAADFLPVGYAVGLLAMAQDRHFRRLGDLAAGTLVVREENLALQRTLELVDPPTLEELALIVQHPALSKGELDAIDVFVRRERQLHPSRAEELAELIAPRLAKRFGLNLSSHARTLRLLYCAARRN